MCLKLYVSGYVPLGLGIKLGGSVDILRDGDTQCIVASGIRYGELYSNRMFQEGSRQLESLDEVHTRVVKKLNGL